MNKEEFKKLIEEGKEATLTIDMVDSLQADFSSAELLRFNSIVEEKSKNPLIVWLLWALLGGFGASMIYLGLKDTNRLINFILCVVGWLTIYFLFGGILIFGAMIWAIFLNISGIKESLLEAKIFAAKTICL